MGERYPMNLEYGDKSKGIGSPQTIVGRISASLYCIAVYLMFSHKEHFTAPTTSP